MSSPAHFEAADDGDPIDEAAAEWFVRRDAGFAPGEAEAFARWRLADPRHAAAWERIQAGAALLEHIPLLAPAVQERLAASENRSAEERSPGWRHAWRVVLPLAALLVFAAMVASWAPWRADPSPAGQRFTAAMAGERFTLADGSVLELNADSAVDVRYSPAERGLTLARGEAHFIVSHDAARPFVVQAGNVSVRAIGTAFNIRLGPSEVEVMVTAGRIRITDPTSDAGANRPTSEWTAGQHVVIAPGRPPRLRELDAAGRSERLAWHGLLKFAETPLADVITQFNQRNAVQVSLGSAVLGRRPVDGSFRADNVEAFVRLLEETGDIVAERPGANRIVLRSAR